MEKVSGQKMKSELGEKGDWWKVTPEGTEIESIAKNNVVGNYFQIEFEAWIQHSGKKLTQICNCGIWNLLCTESAFILDIEEKNSCHGG